MKGYCRTDGCTDLMPASERSRQSAHVVHVISGLADGGAEAVLYRLCRRDRQYRHTVVSLHDEGKYGSLLRDIGVTVQCLDMPRGSISLGGLRRLWQVLRLLRPDVVQTWMYHADLVGGVVARLSGIRAVCWGIHSTDLKRGESKTRTILVARLCSWLSKWVPRRIICCAQTAAASHAASGYDVKKLVVINNGYDLSEFRPNDRERFRLRDELNLPRDLPLIGMVGRFDPYKDHAGLIAALSHVVAANVEFRCVLVGSGMEESNATLRDWIHASGLADRIQLLGRRNDIPAVMNALDVHVLSSLGEAFPNVLAEAMACGTPCVTTDAGDAPLIVGETGWVVPKGQPEALADAIIIALGACRDEEAWGVRCAAARSRVVDRFSVETMVQEYNEIWRTVSVPLETAATN